MTVAQVAFAQEKLKGIGQTFAENLRKSPQLRLTNDANGALRFEIETYSGGTVIAPEHGTKEGPGYRLPDL